MTSQRHIDKIIHLVETIETRSKAAFDELVSAKPSPNDDGKPPEEIQRRAIAIAEEIQALLDELEWRTIEADRSLRCGGSAEVYEAFALDVVSLVERYIPDIQNTVVASSVHRQH